MSDYFPDDIAASGDDLRTERRVEPNHCTWIACYGHCNTKCPECVRTHEFIYEEVKREEQRD